MNFLLRILVQSGNSTRTVMENIDEYVEYTLGYISNMSEAVFQSQINQMQNALKQPVATLDQQMSNWMMTIRSERKDLDFAVKEKTKALLNTIKLADIVDLYKKVSFIFQKYFK